MVDKYIHKNGNIAVLISGGFGAGWSTWNSEHEEEMLFDKDIVQLLLDAPLKHDDDSAYIDKELNDKIEALAKEKWPTAYAGGADQLGVRWLSPGTAFRVHEYDGSESLEIKEKMDWHVA